MVLCRVIRTSAATPVHYLGSVQVNANRLRLLHFNLTCSLRNNTTTRLPLCFSNVSTGYAYHTACTPSLHTGEGREKNRNIFTDYSNVEIGELGHSKRAYISDIAQGPCNYAKCKSLSSPFWLTGSSSRKISGLTELESLLFSSRAKVPAAWLSSVQVRTASSAAAQPKTDDRDDKQTEARQTEILESSTAPPSKGSQGPKSPESEPEQQPEKQPEPEDGKPSKTQQLKKVFKEYGAVGVAFHIGISLISLGICYLAVSSGLDMASLLYRIGFSESVVQSKLAAGTSTFVLAYAVHKLFAPVRISITLVSVPLIVRHLRKTGLFRPPAPPS